MMTLMIYLEKTFDLLVPGLEKVFSKPKAFKWWWLIAMAKKSFSKQFPKNRNQTNICPSLFLSIFIPFCQSWFQPKRKKTTTNSTHLGSTSPPRNGNIEQKKSRLSRLKTNKTPLKKGPFSIGNTSSNRSIFQVLLLFCYSFFSFQQGGTILHLEGTELARHPLTPPPQSMGISHPPKVERLVHLKMDGFTWVGMFPWKRGCFSDEPAVKTSRVYFSFFSANQERWGWFFEVVILIAIPKKVFCSRMFFGSNIFGKNRRLANVEFQMSVLGGSPPPQKSMGFVWFLNECSPSSRHTPGKLRVEESPSIPNKKRSTGLSNWIYAKTTTAWAQKEGVM